MSYLCPIRQPGGPQRDTAVFWHSPPSRVLTILEQALRQLPITTPDEAHATLQGPLRYRRTIAICWTATRAARPAFAAFWASYLSGFRAALRSYGPVTAGPALLDGLRVADLLAGATIVEVKTGHLTETHQFEGLIDQVPTYTLLAAVSGYQVSAVAAYLARYHVLACYPIDALTTELAGGLRGHSASLLAVARRCGSMAPWMPCPAPRCRPPRCGGCWTCSRRRKGLCRFWTRRRGEGGLASADPCSAVWRARAQGLASSSPRPKHR